MAVCTVLPTTRKIILLLLAAAIQPWDRVREAEELIFRHLAAGRRGTISSIEWRRTANSFMQMAEAQPEKPVWRARAAYCRGNAYLESRNTQAAASAFRESLAMDKEWAPAHLMLGITFTSVRKYHDAGDALRAAIQRDPDIAYLRRALGDLQSQIGRHREAEGEFKQALKLAPNMAAAWSSLGLLYAMSSKLGEAEEPLRKALRLDPLYAGGHANLAYYLSLVKRDEEAEQAYKKARSLDPKDPATHYSLGVFYEGRRRLYEAESAYRKAVWLEPGDLKTRFALIRFYYHNGRLEDAREECAAACRDLPGIGILHRELGDILARLGRTPEAEKEFLRAIELEPEVADHHLKIAIFYHMRGSAHRALEYYAKTLKLTTNPEERERVSRLKARCEANQPP